MATKGVAAKRCTEVIIENLLEEVQGAVDSICRRAYEFSAERGFAGGHDLDDWLKAENELFFVPPSDLKESETEYILTASVADFKPDQIAVNVEPQYVTVCGKAAAWRADLPEAAAEAAAGSREMFCRYRLPHAVVVERVKATYDTGELTVTLPKRTEPLEADTVQPAAA